MKIAVALACVILCGCTTMTPKQRKVAYVTAVVVVTAVAIGASNNPSYCGDGRSFCGPIKP